MSQLFDTPPIRRIRRRPVRAPIASPVPINNDLVNKNLPRDHLRCPICLSESCYMVFFECGHYICAADCINYFLSKRVIENRIDVSQLFCVYEKATCPICRRELSKVVDAKFSELVVVPTDDIYRQFDPDNTLFIPKCESCGMQFKGYREYVIHILDVCPGMMFPCTLCGDLVGRDIKTHINTCRGLRCRCTPDCNFRGRRKRVLLHRYFVYISNMVGDLIEMDSLNDDTAQRLVHDIDRVYQTVHDDLDDDTDIEL